MKPTTVYLVGSGPGTRDLLTLRAAELLAHADAIIYDALVDSSIHKLFSSTAEQIYVGKRAGQHALSQEEINHCLIATAQRVGGTIVRLKGGDPFVFGRGGEEMMALHAQGITYEVVPGVTAGIAAPAYAGIPVTHRAMSRSVSFITAFTREGGVPELDWEALVRLEGTLVFYMGMRVVPFIAEALIHSGMRSDMPAAIISHGARANQHVHTAPIASYTEGALDYESYTPGLFVVGDVVTFGQDYGWYHPSPLAGKRVLITRSEAQSSALEERFIAHGAEPILLPTLSITPTNIVAQTECLLEAIDEDDWVLLTSPNGVKYLFEGLRTLGYDSRVFNGIYIGAIGPATADALRTYGIEPNFIPSTYTAEEFLSDFLSLGIEPTAQVFLPTSRIASHTLSDGLTEAGYTVQTLAYYANEPIDYDSAYLEGLLSGGVDWITFCSSSAVHHFIALIDRHNLRDHLANIRMAAIGPITADTLRSYALPIDAMPEVATLDALVEAIKRSV